MSTTYPAHREADVALRDGSTVHVRPIRPDDERRLLALLTALSPDARTLRFFSAGVNLEAIAHHDCQVDHVDRFGLIATTGADERVAGHATYVRIDAERAEIAFTVDHRYQGQGLGTLLLGQLAEHAAANGISQFVADVLPVNYRMLGVFRDSGFPVVTQTRPDEIRITFPTSLTPAAVERFERREQIGAVNALTRVLRPSSIAVIGASSQRGTVGAEVFHNLLAGGFTGPVYPVNPSASVVQSVLAYPSVAAVPGPVDLAVIAVPTASVLEVAEQCGQKGVKALVVLASGFGEAGEEGRQREQALLGLCRTAGMRLIGPNCNGVINTAADVSLNATFGPSAPPAGRVGFASQSGALGLAAMQEARRHGVGLSSFVSMGNKADVSGNDLLQYWEADAKTDLILLYLESFGNPRKFGRIARRVARTKPIIAIKSGRSAAGASTTASQTGALLAASDATVDALFRQAGVIRADTLSGLFDVAALLVMQPVPRGPRVGIVTTAHGPAVLCADTCNAEGLTVEPLTSETQARLRALHPSEARLSNPVMLPPGTTAEQYRAVVETVAADPAIDAVIAIVAQPLGARIAKFADAVASAAHAPDHDKPVLAVLMSAEERQPSPADAPLQVPTYTSPEPATIALARAARYGAWREAPLSSTDRPDGIRHDEAVALVATALGQAECWLPAQDVSTLLDCYGVPTAAPRSEVDGVEMIVGLVQDPSFGPVLACGAGGVAAELIQDVSVRLTPLSERDASDMVRELRTFPLLTGYRGAAPCDVPALEDILRRLGALAEDLPQVVALECSSVRVGVRGAQVVDARVRVAATEAPRPLGARR